MMIGDIFKGSGEEQTSSPLLPCPPTSGIASLSLAENFLGMIPIRLPRGTECSMTARTKSGRDGAEAQEADAKQGA
ncbi:hypothetical protein JOF46_004050 [Paeniglutamicibacter psychrophenolicus]|uniref:Uncharacterized protein n=1 Tax=Paeniglutamicibacter psychrophenolicus TaxID=257454 RepID=A0ABS4WIX3_9MICC|nr:hypothetical protein [Paeniglutamicibacter psychrophenolicus]